MDRTKEGRVPGQRGTTSLVYTFEGVEGRPCVSPKGVSGEGTVKTVYTWVCGPRVGVKGRPTTTMVQPGLWL